MFQTAYVGTRGVKFVMFRFANQVDRITGLRPNPEPAATLLRRQLTNVHLSRMAELVAEEVFS